MDTELGRLVVEQNLATQEEIDKCRAMRTADQARSCGGRF